jgi:hypothetical protein
MKVHRLVANANVVRMVGSIVLALWACQELQAQITYRVEPVDAGGQFIVTGGSVTTDGTLGPLSASNIVAMSVDISHKIGMVGPGGMLELVDGSGTIDLMDAAVSIEGLVEATPTGIRIVRATETGESNSFALLGFDNGPRVTWASAHYDIVLGGNRHTGFHNVTSVYAPPAGGGFSGLPDSGLIARVIPEPSALWLAIIGIGIGASRFRL